MKSRYFTEETIHDKSLEMLYKSREKGKGFRIPFNPERSALIILDMQKYFLDEYSHAFIPSSKPIIPRIRKLAEAFFEINAPVILTRHLNTEDDAGLMKLWWKELITKDDKLSAIIPQLDFPDAIVIEKTQYDGFFRTRLDYLLREKEKMKILLKL